MKESYGEDLASHSGLDPYADHGNVVGVASARGTGRPANELRNHASRAPTLWCQREGNTDAGANGKSAAGTAESKNLSMSEYSKRENREILLVSRRSGAAAAAGNGPRTLQAVRWI